MSKEELRSGLAGWIRDTRKAAETLEQDRGAGRVDLDRLRQVEREGSDEELDELAGHLGDELAKLARAVEILNASSRLPAARRRQLDQELAKLAPKPRQEVTVTADDAGMRRISPSSFAAEVLGSDVPVLVNLVVEGHPPCHETAATLESARQAYGGDVKLCTLDLLAADDDLLPQMLKIGKGFLVKNLPAVLVFWHGRKVGEASGDVEAESLAALIRAEAGPPRGV